MQNFSIKGCTPRAGRPWNGGANYENKRISEKKGPCACRLHPLNPPRALDIVHITLLRHHPDTPCLLSPHRQSSSSSVTNPDTGADPSTMSAYSRPPAEAMSGLQGDRAAYSDMYRSMAPGNGSSILLYIYCKLYAANNVMFKWGWKWNIFKAQN